MWLGLAMSLAGTVASGVGSALANRQRRRDLNSQEANSNAYYLKEMMQDPTKREDNAAFLNQLDRRLKEQSAQAEAKRKITGGTQEQALAQRKYNSDAYADAISNLGAIASQRRDNLSLMRRQEQMGYENMRNDMAAKQMENWGNLANNAMQAGSSALSTLGNNGLFDKKGAGIPAAAPTTPTTNQ